MLVTDEAWSATSQFEAVLRIESEIPLKLTPRTKLRLHAGASEVGVYCSRHPELGTRDSDTRKTHIFGSGKLCFVSGRALQTMSRAQELARQWAEYRQFGHER